MTIKIGDTAPDFTLPSQDGTSVSLKDYQGKSVVLYFYPKDDTPGCTAESCAFRDQYEVFKSAGAEVIGVSGDSPESHQKFATKYQLPFTLLSDKGDKVRNLYGAKTMMGLVPSRITYVIGSDGKIQYIFDSMFNFKGHVEEALKVLQGMQSV
ncbi:peroxiredoxin [Calothrix sp. UHCC 0171]|uniref:peroxiredoxin n=1 Tax=Calothrix sp. UHCC 0171 TaxID=3110245 RepID=UPI002B1EEEEB|nr:peroxiredoxin [Calothrix sp. UHCC 0171]MEA5572338.1 peroxiredoxin [Calothrix sp. UHCC 0171]